MTQRKRLWELDVLRGVAIVLMVIYHLAFSLGFFFDVGIRFDSGAWRWEGRVSAVLFILLAGVASSLIAKKYNGVAYWKRQLTRSFRLIFLGLIISFVTFLVLPDVMIWFGILHFLGLGILLSAPFAKHVWINLFLATLSFALGGYLDVIHPDHYYGLIFGLHPNSFQSLDYYPLFPHAGWIFIGMAVGNLVYKEIRFDPISLTPTILKPMAWLGRCSLWIYMLHQPILLGLLWIVFYLFFA